MKTKDDIQGLVSKIAYINKWDRAAEIQEENGIVFVDFFKPKCGVCWASNNSDLDELYAELEKLFA